MDVKVSSTLDRAGGPERNVAFVVTGDRRREYSPCALQLTASGRGHSLTAPLVSPLMYERIMKPKRMTRGTALST